MGQDEEDSFDESYVYEEFSGIRSSFEQLIDRHGYEAIEDTMRKVVKVLSKFEALIASQRQADLQLANSQLTLEEEKETSSQKDQISKQKIRMLEEQKGRLSERNMGLQQKLQDIQASQQHEEQTVSPVETSEVLEKLNNVIATQTKALNELRDEYEELTVHNTKQSSLILKLKAGLQESVHSHRALKARNDRLINEKAALEARLVAAGVKEVVGRESSTSEAYDQDALSNAGNQDPCTGERRHSVSDKAEGSVQDKDVIQARLDYQRSASQVIRGLLSKNSPLSYRKQPNKCICEESGYKFTVDEMTMLINERNIAKEKLLVAEEELSFVREQDGFEVVTEEGFAMLESPRISSPITNSLFHQLSRDDDS